MEGYRVCWNDKIIPQVVSLIMSVGIAVEFTVHLVLAYLDAVHNNDSDNNGDGSAGATDDASGAPRYSPQDAASGSSSSSSSSSSGGYSGRAAGVEAALLLMFAPVLDGGAKTGPRFLPFSLCLFLV